MKKIIVILALALASQFVSAQRSVNNELPDRLFKQGKEMYLDKNYVGSQHALADFVKVSEDERMKAEAEYMLVGSYYFLGDKRAGEMMKEYLDTYPSTYHRDRLSFYIGSTHFEDKDWKRTLFWFNDVDVDYLSAVEQEDYTYRRAYATLQSGDVELARQSFGLLSQNSKKYKEAATYYLAYTDFKKGDYDKALRVFERYKNIPEYKEDAQFFLLQGAFLKNELNSAISQSESYIKTYPSSKNLVEVYRILGNSYNRTGDRAQSISYYEKYLALDENPVREDMYLLGTSYSAMKEYQKAIDALELVATPDDAIGQAAYMQLGQNYLALNDYTNALMAFEAAAREKHDVSISEVAMYNYAVLVHRTSLSAFDQSVTALERFLTEYPGSAYTKNINALMASTILSTKNYKAALNIINKLKSPDSQILAAKQSILFHIGTEDFINGDYSSALNNFVSSINLGNYDATARRQAYFWRGETYYRLGNYGTAIGDYSNFVSSAPATDANYGLALYNLGYSQFQLKQYSKALGNFQKYTGVEKNKSKNTYPDAMNRIGDCYLFERNFSAAERSYSQAASIGGEGADYADFQKAFVLGLQKNYSGKISALDAMMKRYPNSQYKDDALFEKSRAYVMLGNEKQAISVLDELMRMKPQPQMAQEAGLLLGQLNFNANNYTKAISAYKSVVAVNSTTDEARAAIQSMENIYKETNDINSYVSYVNSLGSGIIISSTRQDSLTYQAAENLFMKGQSSGARSAMQSYIHNYPKGAFVGDAHFSLGSIAYDQGNKDQALSEFMATINSSNSRYMNEALSLAANLQYEKSAYDTANDLYKQLSVRAVDSEQKSTARLGMLRCAVALKKDSEVISSATAVLADTKTSPEVQMEAHLLRAKSYLNQKNTDKATPDLQQAGKDVRSVYGAEAQYLLAEIFYKAKAYDKAEKQILEFSKTGTPHQYWLARALILLSDNYVAKGDKFKAREYLQSLQANYKNAEADITSMVNERLATLKN
ncbi:tetratricopeptide repeat protein [Dysgonomonas sp. 520]|uniref:tetratricopeptide repeat protein n=1 Tax=Dysgonomonas sp. 520 TaxID=2302931 RepID=UPI0013D3500E|nr:tetratricopeptide repeat protein [Dysgonomonas sp. 520]NDW10271.1 hypothetical protein [Dysgonomonas sp. 520]